jgi:hypothetical protein
MDGGGVRRDEERLRAKSWCAFLECERARCGTAGVSVLEAVLLEERVPEVVADRLGDKEASKKLVW